MAAPGFYDDRAAAQPIIDRHQALMWNVGELMSQWERLSSTDAGDPSRGGTQAETRAGAATGD